MNLVFSSALGWVVAVAIALPIIVMFWWARRNAPAADYEVLTPERVRLQYDIAGIGSRSAAALIDTLIQGLLYTALSVLVLFGATLTQVTPVSAAGPNRKLCGRAGRGDCLPEVRYLPAGPPAACFG